MRFYETVILYRQDITPEQAEFLTAQFAKNITQKGGKTVKAEYWGLRSLAYKINKNKKAHYVMLQSETDHAAIAEMERIMRINEDVIRFLTFSVDALAEEDSIIMKDSNGARHFNLDVEKAPEVSETSQDTPSAYHEQAN